MKIGVLSGKGGTGKTFIATNLVSVLEDAYYLDCDVEEPNGDLFFNRDNVRQFNIDVDIPSFNREKCIGCKKCVEFCNFNALAYIGNDLYISKETCHSCGACILFCPEEALDVEKHNIGKILEADIKNNKILTGILNPGESSGTFIINSMIDRIKGLKNHIIVDAPPGVACTVMDSIIEVDYCVVVVEPSIFGLENFKMVEELLTLFKKPFGIIINKVVELDNIVKDYSKERDIHILAEVPFDKNLAKIISEAQLATEYSEYYKKFFSSLFENIRRNYENETVTSY